MDENEGFRCPVDGRGAGIGARRRDSRDPCGGGIVQSVSAADNVAYLDADGVQQTQSNATDVTSDDTTWTEGWYVVSSNVTVSNRITVDGDVHLILADGYTLTASSGITVSGEGNCLTIYGQENGTGTLTAGSSFLSAAIGGMLHSEGYTEIVINGGTINAEGMAAGIGGGYNSGYDATKGVVYIEINGGTITATGGEGAGIGSGATEPDIISDCYITINGGSVNATGGRLSAAIGGGTNGNCDVTITGGTVYAKGTQSGAGIGSGTDGNLNKNELHNNVSITGGIVTAIGGSAYSASNGSGAAIGSSGTARYGLNSGPVEGEEVSDAGFTNCIVYRNANSTGNQTVGNVYGSVTLPGNYTIEKETTLTIPEGATLTVPENTTLTVEGTLIIEGTLIKNGTIQNNGTLSCLAHQSNGNWSSNANGHYHVCVICGNNFDEAAHTPKADDGNCTTDIKCSVCGYVTTEGLTAHNFGGDYLSDANGHWQKCQNTGCDVTSGPVNHSGGTATCTVQAVCTTCNASYGDFAAHTLTHHTAAGATCTGEGNREYWSCSVCGKNFADENGAEEIIGDVIIPSTGHTLTFHEEIPATCEADGQAAYYSCANCDGLFSDEEGKIPVTLAELVISATGHTLTAHPAVDPTYTSGGMKAYSQCAACGKIFDENGVETTLDALRIPALTPEPEEEETYIPSEPISDGFREYSLGTMLYQGGKRVRGLYEYEGATYFFNDQGFMQTGWVEFDEGWRYFAGDGKMVTGWLKLGNVWYYLDPETGLMYADGLYTIGKATYYFYDWGGMANDWWYEAEDGWYFFGGSGAMKTAQWTQWKGEWYYLTETGKMAADAVIGGYYVNADGAWIE